MALSAVALNTPTTIIEDGRIRYSVRVHFYDPVNLPAGEDQTVFAYFNFTDTPSQMENAIEDAILDIRAQFYPSLTLSRGDIIMYDIKKGS